MKQLLTQWRRPALFTAAGALAGLTYYGLVGCATGSCPITVSPVHTMLYTGLMGWLLSCGFAKEDRSCNT